MAGAHTRQPQSGSNLTRSMVILQAGIVAGFGGRMTRERARAFCRWIVVCLGLASVSVRAAGGLSSIKSQDLREWLTYIASDELQGRAVYSTGLGLAAAYVGDHVRAWGL